MALTSDGLMTRLASAQKQKNPKRGALQRVPSGSINRIVMATGKTDDPQHWRERAAKMRELARTMTDTETAILMNDLAADYDKLAERAEIRNGGKRPPSKSKLR